MDDRRRDDEDAGQTEAEAAAHERGYVEGALAAWKSIQRLVEREVQSYGGIVASWNAGEADD